MLNALLMIDSALLIILTLLQGGKSDGISGAFTGNGSEKVISNLTLVLGILFFVLVILIRVL